MHRLANIFRRLSYLLAAFILPLSISQAASVSPTSLTIVAGSTATVQVTNISKSLTVQSSNTSFFTATASSVISGRATVTVSAIAQGSGTLTIRDSKGTKTIPVTVTANQQGTTNGRLLASNCFQCHGTNGGGGFDRLTGESYENILSELKKYASGEEAGSGIMSAHVKGYTLPQLEALARYFSAN